MENDNFHIVVGACHADDIGYLFKNDFTIDLSPDSPEIMAVRRLVRLWTNFAKYGNPTPDGQDFLLNNIYWPSVTNDKFWVLNIDSDLKVLTAHPETKALEFWEKFHTKFLTNSKL